MKMWLLLALAFATATVYCIGKAIEEEATKEREARVRA
jgi:hypothetical protein